MTMNEKRYFKVFCSRHTIGSQNNYVKLFDIIEKISNYSEAAIKEALHDKKYPIKFLASDLKYLKKILLKSLNDFHYDKTSDMKLKQQLLSIEILFYKGLYEECLQLIQKVKLNAAMLNSQFLILELLNWEKKCIGYSKGLLNAIEINNKIEDSFKEIELGKVITDFYYKSYYLKNSVGKIPLREMKTEFDLIFNHDIFTRGFDLKFVNFKIYYNLIFANYYHIIANYSNEQIYLQKTIDIYNENEFQKFENPLDYISVHTRLIELVKFGDSDTFYRELSLLKSFNSMIDIQKEVANERIFLFCLQAELEHLFSINQSNHAMKLMNDILERLPKTKYKIEPYHYIKLYYLIASVYCINNNFSSGLKYVNKIINEYKFNERPNTFIKTEFLNIVIHFEIKNYDLVLHHISSFKKKYSKIYALNAIEKNMLKTLNKIATDPMVVSEKKEFKILLQKISTKHTETAQQMLNSNYLKYIIKKAT